MCLGTREYKYAYRCCVTNFRVRLVVQKKTKRTPNQVVANLLLPYLLLVLSLSLSLSPSLSLHASPSATTVDCSPTPSIFFVPAVEDAVEDSGRAFSHADPCRRAQGEQARRLR
jgi:hypothetical protein